MHGFFRFSFSESVERETILLVIISFLGFGDSLFDDIWIPYFVHLELGKWALILFR